jgi:mono/diheme cytochrome c family protein
VGKTMSPAALNNLLHHPNGKMQAGGMPAVKLGDTDMSALVAYIHDLGAGAAPPAAGAASPGTAPAGGSPMAAHDVAASSHARAMSGLESRGQGVFRAHGCANCHGTDGAGGTAAAPALAGTGAGFAAVQLTTLLQHPTVRMQRGGMPPVSLSTDALGALVAYVRFISASHGKP